MIFTSRTRTLLLGLLAFALSPLARATTGEGEDTRTPSPPPREVHVPAAANSGNIFLSRRTVPLQNWRPSGKIPKAELDKVVAAVRAQADEDNHTYCLFDTSDNCFLRNTKIKFDLSEKGFDIANASATILIVESGTTGKWGYHTAAVFYTDQGPFVFDPDNKEDDEIYDGKLLTPLAEWLRVQWDFSRPVRFLAPPGVIVPSDVPNHPAYFASEEAKQKFWEEFKERVPSDPIFDRVRGKEITEARVNRYRRVCPALPGKSKEKYIEIRRARGDAPKPSHSPATVNP